MALHLLVNLATGITRFYEVELHCVNEKSGRQPRSQTRCLVMRYCW